MKKIKSLAMQEGISLIEVLVSLLLLTVVIIGFMDAKLKALSHSYQQYVELTNTINSQNAVECEWIKRLSKTSNPPCP